MDILSSVLTFSPDVLPKGIVGLPYKNADGSPVVVTPEGGEGTEFINFTMSGLPAGLSWDEGTRTIGGIPTSAGTGIKVIAEVWNRSGSVGVKIY